MQTCRPADSEGSVDSFQHGIEPLRQIALLRNFKLDTTIADFVFARKSRWPIVFGGTRKALSNTTRIQTRTAQHKRVCMAGSIAG